MKQLLTLEEWALDKYRSKPPCLNTLRMYAKNNYFSPPAAKHGRSWRVTEDAEIVGSLTHPISKFSDSPKLKRILNDGSQTPEK